MSAHVNTTATAVKLGLNDHWASEVLQGCARAHCTPRQGLLEVLAPMPHPTAGHNAAAGSVAGVAGTAVTQGRVVIDVDTEACARGQPLAASPNISSAEGSGQPCLRPTQSSLLSTEMQALREALSPVLLRKAYRLQMPCVTKHVDKKERLLNCTASPRCMAGLQALGSDSATREECIRAIMGDGPEVVSIGTKKVGRFDTVSGGVVPPSPSSLSLHDGAAPAVKTTRKEMTEGSSTAMVTEDAERTVMDDPSFPCLWRGVRNLMNTCYFSSVLQLLFSIAQVRHAILNDDAPADADDHRPHLMMMTETQGGRDSNQLAESGLKELFSLMAFSREGAGADPTSFATYLSLDFRVQQDAQEFFTLLLDWLRCHCGSSVKATVTSTFSGTLLYDRQCGACGWSFKRAEQFLYLSLPVHPSLEDSLSEFLKPESVDGFKCEKCGQTAMATSLQYMRTLPDVLVIHLNRFEYNLHTQQRHKVTTTTSFPLQLDMRTYMQQWYNQKRDITSAVAGGDGAMPEESEARHVYELRGVVNHLGDTAVSGHYTYHGKVSSASPSLDETGDGGGSWWLNFNDAEVSRLSRYKGHRGVSPEAYLLVYHRITSSSSSPMASSVLTSPVTSRSPRSRASDASPPTGATPTPQEFPIYLRQYVDRVNEGCLARRREWIGQRAQVSALFDAWAAAAKAIFESGKNTYSAPAWISAAAVAKASTPSLYLLPTRWLQHFGRFFLPAYVDTAALGGGVESKLKRKRGESDAVADAVGDGASSAAANDSPMVGIHAAIVGREEGSQGSDAGAVAEGTVVAAASDSFLHGHMKTLDDVCQLVRQQSYQQALSSMTCAHGYVSPWISYKVVSAFAYEKLSHFLALCGVPLTRKTGDGTCAPSPTPGAAAAGRLGDSLSGDARLGYSLTDANLCPVCVVAMAAGVQALALRSGEDEEAEMCLTQAWEESERRREAAGKAASEGGGGAEPVAAMTTSGTTGVQDRANREGQEEDQQKLVLVSRTVVGAWASFYTSQLCWGSVQQTEGYTGVLVMREARVTSASFSAVTSSKTGVATSAASPGPSIESPKVPETVSVSFMRSGELVRLSTFALGGGDLDVSKQLLCPHGALRPGVPVMAIPESVRRYWVRRFVEIFTMERRAGFLRPTSPHLSVCESSIEQLLLPRIPLSAAGMTCHQCTRSSAQYLTSRQHQRMKRMEEQKRYPSLWLAGAMTSAAGVTQMMLASGVESEEQLLATQHPNRIFFRQHGERDYREYVKRWTDEHQQRVAHQLSEVQRLRTTLEKKQQHDDAWSARVTMRRGRAGRGRGKGAGATGNSSLPSELSSPEAATVAPDPQTLEGRLYYAEEALQSMSAQTLPDYTVAYGCVPTWWVAQWYAAMQSDDGNSGANGSGGESDDQPLLALPRISFKKFRCVHGKVLLDLSWLNPSDGFWQGARAKRADMLWNGVHMERCAASSATPPSTGFTTAESCTRCWLPPMIIVPMDEFSTLLAQYGEPDMLDRASLSTGHRAGALPPGTGGRGVKPCPEATDVDAEATNVRSTSGVMGKPAEPSVSSTADGKSISAPLLPAAVPVAKARAQPVPVADAVIQVCFHNGTRQLRPTTCEECCGVVLSSFDTHSESFVNGSLRLNIHVRKSRKNYYDATSILTSSAVQLTNGNTAGRVGDSDNTNNATTDSIPAGIHYYTTLAQLKDYISVHLRERHGYLVPASVLQIGRGKNKPLKRRSPLPQSAETAEDVHLDDATLHELGIHDGETLSVQSVDVIAPVCAKTAAIDEEWETIPMELLQCGGASVAPAAQEHTVAFRETRLQGNHSGFVPAASSAVRLPVAGVTSSTKVQGVSCSVCTFLNAPGMIICEMCEAPLPSA